VDGAAKGLERGKERPVRGILLKDVKNAGCAEEEGLAGGPRRLAMESSRARRSKKLGGGKYRYTSLREEAIIALHQS